LYWILLNLIFKFLKSKEKGGNVKYAVCSIMTFVVLSFCFSIAAADVLIICNESVPVRELSKSKVKSIFFDKESTWGDGQGINFVILRSKSKIHKEFTRKYLKKTPSQYKNYFKKRVFTGKGKAPRSLKSEKDVISYIAQTEGAIGYISPKSKTGDLNIMQIK
jgi:ABC-type phosphate transport system substrate-binding protein